MDIGVIELVLFTFLWPLGMVFWLYVFYRVVAKSLEVKARKMKSEIISKVFG